MFRLYNKTKKDSFIAFNGIYLINILFLAVGFFRFYIPLIKNDYLIYLNAFIILIIFLLLLLYLFLAEKKSEVFTFFTGLIIFYPICFVTNPVHAILMGVTMHYSQYLLITHKVLLAKIKHNQVSSSTYFKFFLFILFYSILMTVLATLNKYNIGFTLENLILIPLVFQMLHFYIDSQLWKASDDYIRNNIFKFIFIK